MCEKARYVDFGVLWVVRIFNLVCRKWFSVLGIKGILSTEKLYQLVKMFQ